MNFLAHLVLAAPDGKSMIGNLMPDLVVGRLPAELHPDVALGVQLHRRVDRFTDTHPVVGQTKARLREHHGLFAGILVDVFYDHLLAADWRRWRDQTLDDFARFAYQQMAGDIHHAPPTMREALTRMADQNWLCCYATVAGVELTLQRMSERLSRRMKRTFDVPLATADLIDQLALLRADFDRFFPLLIAHADKTALIPAH